MTSSHSRPDRWALLFADLEAELAAAEEAEFAAEVADRTRAEFARVRLVDRLRGSGAAVVTLVVNTGQPGGIELSGVVAEVGPDWLLVDTRVGKTADALSFVGSHAVVRLGAVLTVTGLPAAVSAPGSEGHVAARYGLPMVLRRLARDRSAFDITLTNGDTSHGTLDRVGADFVDIAQHAAGEPRRRRAVQQVITVPHEALAVLRCR